MKNKLLFGLCIVAVMAVILVIYSSRGDYIDRLVEKYQPQGAVIALFEDGEIKDIRSYGYSNIDNNERVNENTLFQVASISKTFTAYAIMQLADQGVIDLDVPVNTYLKSYQLQSGSFPADEVTLRTLLSHTSGICGTYKEYEAGEIPDNLTALKNADITVEKKPGTEYAYSEFLGYGICQVLVEDVTGMAFSDYMKKEVLPQMGLVETNYIMNCPKDIDVAVPYAGFGKAVDYNVYPEEASAGVVTSGRELADFAIALMKYYKSSDDEMFKPYETSMDDNVGYALGIQTIETKSGKTVYWHNGTLTGCNAQFAFEPQSGNGMAIITNSDRAFYMTYELMDKWGEKVLGESRRDNKVHSLERIIQTAVQVIAIILAAFLISVFFRISSQKLVPIEKGKRVLRRCVYIGASVIFMALYVLCVYTDFPGNLLFGIQNYYLFTFFPPVFHYVFFELLCLIPITIYRLGFTKRKGKQAPQNVIRYLPLPSNQI